MTTTAAQTAPVATAARPLRDVRGFWRVLLAVFAPMPFLAMGIYYLLLPIDAGARFADTVAAWQANSGMLNVTLALDVIFCVGLIPATYAVTKVARLGAPRLTTAGGFLSLFGFLVGFGLLGGPLNLEVMTVRYGLDPATIAPLADARENDLFFNLSGLLFLIGVVFGLTMLGIALWRSRYAPAWAGVLVILGGATHPFLPGHVAQGIGLLMAAVGYAGASMALLRMGNDGFDVAPARP